MATTNYPTSTGGHEIVFTVTKRPTWCEKHPELDGWPRLFDAVESYLLNHEVIDGRSAGTLQEWPESLIRDEPTFVAVLSEDEAKILEEELGSFWITRSRLGV